MEKLGKQTTEGKPMSIFGTGEQRRDYLHIDDAVDAYLLALTERFDGPVNFGTGTTVSIRDLAYDIAIGVHGPAPIPLKSLWEFGPVRKGEVDCLRCDSSKARAMGWSPQVDFKEGIRRYITWTKT